MATLMNVPDVHSGQASSRDLDGLAKIQAWAEQELPRVQLRAEKWTTGLTAVAGVLSTAFVIKGPDALAKIAGDRLIWVASARGIVLIFGALGGVCLAGGIWRAYQAAYGSPLADGPIDALVRSPSSYSSSPASAWTSSVHQATVGAKRALRQAALLTAAGLTFAGAAAVVASYNPAQDSVPPATCVRTSDGQLLRFHGSLPSLDEGALTAVACPRT